MFVSRNLNRDGRRKRCCWFTFVLKKWKSSPIVGVVHENTNTSLKVNQFESEEENTGAEKHLKAIKLRGKVAEEQRYYTIYRCYQ